MAVFLAVDFFAVDFFAVDLVGADLRAVDVDVVLFDAVFFALLFFAADFAGADFFAVVFLAVDLVLDAFLAALDLAAGADLPLVLRAAGVALATLSLGSFLAPETTALSSAPARNFGTAVFLARTRAPVAGLRTIRDGRIAFSKAPKPVIATFSPLATSREIVSTTESRALDAALLLPS